MGRRCAVGGCKSTKGLHYFPTIPSVAEKWTLFVRSTREGWSGPRRFSYIFSKHFVGNDFAGINVGSSYMPIRRGIDGAVPSRRTVGLYPTDRLPASASSP